jgi:hypothetical protein
MGMLKRFLRMAAFLAPLVVFLPFQAAADGPYRRLPWHLVDIYWKLDSLIELEPFKDFAMDVTIEGDPLASPPLYIAPMGLFWLGEAKAYAGLQTWLKHDPQGNRGPGIIFSRFGERREDHLKVAPGGVFESAGYEGDFISVRHGMPWSAGNYVAKLQSEPRPSAPGGGRWVSFQVCVKVESACASAGDLAFPNPNAALRSKFYSFVEIYDKLKSEDDITPVTVIFGPPKVNGKIVPVMKAVARYPADVPFRVTSRRTSDGGVKMIVGPKRLPSELPVQDGFRQEQVLP